MVMVILVFVLLWNFDVHRILFVKLVAQNAGDAAALAASRWQGISLNLIGDLNLMQALALSVGDVESASSITSIQARLCYVGPMVAFVAAQQAAKNNGMFRNPDFDAALVEHARRVREDYPLITDANNQPLFPEPYPGCWREYADMLELIAQDGVAAGPDNVQYYGDAVGGHFLLLIDFYEAIAGRMWCWFFWHAMDLLEQYTNYLWWPPLPEIPHMEYINSEIFGLGLTRRTTTLRQVVSTQLLVQVASARGFPLSLTNAVDLAATWYCYGRQRWTSWDVMRTDGDNPFPLTGPVKPQYDYTGADAVVRVEALSHRLTPGAGGVALTNRAVWTAAAKPFGFLGEVDRPDTYTLVLPAFHDVRLIPVDSSSAPSGGGYNIEWRRHIGMHLQPYLERGISACDPNCWYCQQLVTWEDPAFRAAGLDWLRRNSDQCERGGGGGGGGGGGDGGSRIGH